MIKEEAEVLEGGRRRERKGEGRETASSEVDENAKLH